MRAGWGEGVGQQSKALQRERSPRGEAFLHIRLPPLQPGRPAPVAGSSDGLGTQVGGRIGLLACVTGGSDRDWGRANLGPVLEAQRLFWGMFIEMSVNAPRKCVTLPYCML